MARFFKLMPFAVDDEAIARCFPPCISLHCCFCVHAWGGRRPTAKQPLCMERPTHMGRSARGGLLLSSSFCIRNMLPHFQLLLICSCPFMLHILYCGLSRLQQFVSMRRCCLVKSRCIVLLKVCAMWGIWSGPRQLFWRCGCWRWFGFPGALFFVVCELSSANTCAFQLMKYFHCLLQSTHFLLVSCPCSISLIYFLALHHLLFAPGRLCGLCHGNPDCSDDGCLRPSFASSTDPVTCAHLVPSFVSKNTELVCCLETSCGFLSPFCPLLCVIHCYFVFYDECFHCYFSFVSKYVPAWSDTDHCCSPALFLCVFLFFPVVSPGPGRLTFHCAMDPCRWRGGSACLVFQSCETMFCPACRLVFWVRDVS